MQTFLEVISFRAKDTLQTIRVQQLRPVLIAPVSANDLFRRTSWPFGSRDPIQYRQRLVNTRAALDSLHLVRSEE